MAFTGRTTADIYEQITNEISTMDNLLSLVPQLDTHQDLLDDLSSASSVAIWRLFTRTIAYAISTFERNLEEFEDDIQDIIDAQKIMTSEWYVQKSLEYQDGDTISVNETTYEAGYESLDESKQIITSASLEEIGNRVILKVIKTGGALNTDEKTRFETYINKIKALGTKIEVRSVDGDKLKLYMTIVYNGEKRLGDVQTNVESTINTYITNLPFNSKIKVISLIDELQKIDGVDDVRFTSAEATDVLGDTTAFSWEYQSYAGWCSIDSLYPLSTTITYTGKYN
jgi:hypothetical protein